MNILFTVCGRAGSTGCPHKNERDFLGVPLLYYTLAAIYLFKQCYNQDTIDIILSTDSKDLISISQNQKMIKTMILNRAANLSSNNVPKIEVIKDALSYCEREQKKNYQWVIDLDITSPLRTVESIKCAFEKIQKDPDYDIVFSAVESRRSPFFNMVKMQNKYATLVEDSAFFRARQEIPETFDMNASIYVYNCASFKKNTSNRLFDAKCGLIPMMDIGILDIDSPLDFELMEHIAIYIYKQYPQYQEIQEMAYNLSKPILHN